MDHSGLEVSSFLAGTRCHCPSPSPLQTGPLCCWRPSCQMGMESNVPASSSGPGGHCTLTMETHRICEQHPLDRLMSQMKHSRAGKASAACQADTSGCTNCFFKVLQAVCPGLVRAGFRCWISVSIQMEGWEACRFVPVLLHLDQVASPPSLQAHVPRPLHLCQVTVRHSVSIYE